MLHVLNVACAARCEREPFICWQDITECGIRVGDNYLNEGSAAVVPCSDSVPRRRSDNKYTRE